MSKQSRFERKAKIRKGEPITIEIGEPKQPLTFYPITMSHYEEFIECKNAWAIRMTTLPPQYMQMPYLQALWAVDYDTALATGSTVGLFARCLKLLYLSLRLGYERDNTLQGVYTVADTPRQLAYIEVTQDGHTVKITPQDFTAYIRPLVAQQNGIELPDESYDQELVRAEEIEREKAQGKLKFDIATLIASVAYQNHIRARDIDDWTILEFEQSQQAIERDKRFMINQQAAMSGMVSFKGSIPYPSWCLDEDKTLSGALRTTEQAGQHFKAVGDLTQMVQSLNNQTKKS